MKGQATNSAVLFGSFWRGFPVAALSAAAVLAVQSGDLRYVGVTSFAVNYWWWGNVQAVNGTRAVWAWSRVLFALGASGGSVLTVYLLR